MTASKNKKAKQRSKALKQIYEDESNGLSRDTIKRLRPGTVVLIESDPVSPTPWKRFPVIDDAVDMDNKHANLYLPATFTVLSHERNRYGQRGFYLWYNEHKYHMENPYIFNQLLTVKKTDKNLDYLGANVRVLMAGPKEEKK